LPDILSFIHISITNHQIARMEAKKWVGIFYRIQSMPALNGSRCKARILCGTMMKNQIYKNRAEPKAAGSKPGAFYFTEEVVKKK
jgi:hypothetical protein